jgi:hypothetical protein
MIKNLTPNIKNWVVMNDQILTITMCNQVKNYINFNEALDSIINMNILAKNSAAKIASINCEHRVAPQNPNSESKASSI